MAAFEHSTDVAAGGWIAPRLAGAFGAVGRVCPTGFEAYARVFHPVDQQDATGTELSWAEVAARTGRVSHPLMQWSRISGVFSGTRLFGDWNGAEPRTGALLEAHLARLAAAIGGDDPVTIGLWNGYGHLDETTRSRPTLELPGRSYLLFRGTVATLRDPDWRRASGWVTLWDETLNLAWPDDHSWFVASEIDYDSTIVGGSRQLIDRILASDLETAEVEATADLSSRGDVVKLLA